MRAFKSNLMRNKTVIVTGANGILGKTFCSTLLKQGANVAAIDLKFEQGDFFGAKKRAEHSKKKNDIKFFQCDISDERAVNKCVDEILGWCGSVNALINSAATKTASPENFFAPFETYSIATWKEVMSVNVDGSFLMSRRVGNEMAKGDGGSIILISSIYGLVGPDDRIYEGSQYNGLQINTPAVYSTSKAALIGLTKWLATHWADKNVRVNCIAPGGVQSGQNEIFDNNYSSRVPMKRMAKGEEIATVAIFLSSDAASYINGQTIAVDGGFTSW